MELLFPLSDDPVYLPCGDIHSKLQKLLQYQGLCYMGKVVLMQNISNQSRTKMTPYFLWQLADEVFVIRCLPASYALLSLIS